MRTALTIAGSDPSGGAGIQADLKTFAALGVYGTSAITALTVQNTRGVTRVEPVAAELVAAQIDAIVADLGADAVKLGMLANAAIVLAVADAIARHALERVVADPVMAATGGHILLDAQGRVAFRERLMPLAAVVTPNALEAEALTGIAVRTPADQRAAARRLVDLGARAAIVKGGHVAGPPDGPGSGAALDILFDGRTFTELSAVRIDSRHTHGTGCAFSAALAARLALGDDLVTAAKSAKAYVTGAIAHAPGLGHGRGPLHHTWPWK
jgi:hydroxymethylpyrimidine/phosphomethylpyrimidine kinase